MLTFKNINIFINIIFYLLILNRYIFTWKLCTTIASYNECFVKNVNSLIYNIKLRVKNEDRTIMYQYIISTSTK